MFGRGRLELDILGYICGRPKTKNFGETQCGRAVHQVRGARKPRLVIFAQWRASWSPRSPRLMQIYFSFLILIDNYQKKQKNIFVTL